MMLTESGSTEIKAMLDIAQDQQTLALAAAHPLEYDEWCDEVDRGDRPWSNKALKASITRGLDKAAQRAETRWFALVMMDIGGSE